MNALTDNALMLRVRDGDLDKMSLLFERYKRPLYGFFYHLNKDEDLSEDLVQTVFYRILKYRARFRGDGDFRSWMFHIARNVSHDHYRKNKLKKDDPLEAWQDRLEDGESAAAAWQQHEEKQLLSRALEQLSDDKREVLLLSKFQEKKYKEIGDILGCSEGAVKVKVFRALQELKEVYQKLEERY